MSDDEITKLCAEAMGPDSGIEIDGLGGTGSPYHISGRRPYDPLHDDAQAMALVKKFTMSVYNSASKGGWLASEYTGSPSLKSRNRDLNRAICECVAKMQASRSP